MAFDGGDIITVENDLIQSVGVLTHRLDLKFAVDENFKARPATDFINAAISLRRHTLSHKDIRNDVVLGFFFLVLEKKNRGVSRNDDVLAYFGFCTNQIRKKL